MHNVVKLWNEYMHNVSFQYEDDEEKAEEFKIRSLIAMVHGCDTVGVPYSSTGNIVLTPVQ